MVFDVAAMAGWLRPPTRAVHVAFGIVLGPDRKMLKSRSGEPVRFVDVVDEAIERATASVKEKNPDLPIEEQTDIGRMVGIGALKYADLSTDRIKDYVFDWDRMLAFEGNTAPYLQYAHARIRSILRRAGETEVAARPTPSRRSFRKNATSSSNCCSSTPPSTTRSTSTARTACARTSSTWRRASRRSTRRARC